MNEREFEAGMSGAKVVIAGTVGVAMVGMALLVALLAGWL